MVARQTSGLPDHELVHLVAAGDVGAFEVIYDRYSALAFGLAMRVTGRRSAAEEVTQEAFLSFWRSAPRYDPDRGTLKSWLLSVVRNRGIDSLRRGAAHGRTVEIDEAVAERLEAAERTEEQVTAREEARQARRLLTSLSSDQREVIELAFFGGLTQMEIATRTGTPLGTVKSRQRLALTKMHRELKGDPQLALAG